MNSSEEFLSEEREEREERVQQALETFAPTSRILLQEMELGNKEPTPADILSRMEEKEELRSELRLEPQWLKAGLPTSSKEEVTPRSSSGTPLEMAPEKTESAFMRGKWSEQIYVLRLEQDKWYIGKTKNLLARMQYHLRSSDTETPPSLSSEDLGLAQEESLRSSEGLRSSEDRRWTKIYKVLRVEELSVARSDFDEDTITKKYMRKYGIQNVRGGSYTTEHLSDATISLLEKEFQTSQDKCFSCGKFGHLSRDCSSRVNTKPIFGKRVANVESSIPSAPKISEKKRVPPSHSPLVTWSPTQSLNQGLATGPNQSQGLQQKKMCTRCGRNTHFVDTCHAKTHLNGYPL